MDTSCKEYEQLVKIYDSLKKVGEDNNVRAIKRVVLLVGDGALVDRSLMAYMWKDFVKEKNEDMLKNSEMICEGIRLQSKCLDCSKTFDTSKFGKTCPYCNSENTQITQGVEIFIKQIEVFDY